MDKIGDKMVEEIENQRHEELSNGESISWDILEGVEHFVYHEHEEMRTELYSGSNYDFAEKEFETAVKYFGGKDE